MGGFSFHVHSTKLDSFDLEKVQKDLLTKGCLIFSLDHGSSSWIAALPTTDKYDALLAVQTNGVNCDLMPQDIVAWLRKMEEDQPFVLIAAGSDFVAGKFTSKIAKPTQLAKRIVDLCPDTDGEARGVAADLKKSQSFFLWWD
jgi:Domain of unknown function (DUF4253)